MTRGRVCVCWRKQERPCTRCVKRNIGHLCHDEPREHETKKPKSLPTAATQQQQQQQQPQQQQQKQDPGSQADPGRSALNQNAGAMRPLSFDAALGNRPGQAAKSAFEATTLAGRGGNPLQLVQPTPVSGIAANALGSGMSQCMWLGFISFLDRVPFVPCLYLRCAGELADSDACRCYPQFPISQMPGWLRRTLTTTCITSTRTM